MRWSDRSEDQKVALLKIKLENLIDEFGSHEHGKQGSVLTSPDWENLDYSDEGLEEE